MIVALAMLILWYNAMTGRGYMLRIDFTFVISEAIGAEVVVDGEVVDTIEMLRRHPINGVRVPNGEHVVVIQSEHCGGLPMTVVPGPREKTVSLFVHLNERTVENRFVCRFAMRRR